jgi:hypothetical protein
MTEASGTTIYDLSGNNSDSVGSPQGTPTWGQTGILGTNSVSFDNNNSETIGLPQPNWSGGVTWSVWFKQDSSTGDYGGIYSNVNNDGAFWGVDKGGTNTFYNEGGTATNASGSSYSTGVWYHVAIIRESGGGGWTLYLNGSSDVNNTTSADLTPTNGAAYIGGDSQQGDWYVDGNIQDFRVYDTALSAADVQTLYDVVDKQSTLTTATKSFSSPVKPDLQNLSYSLNGQSIDVEVIGSPSGSSESVVQTLGGASSYSLNWSNSHSNFRIKTTLESVDKTVTPTISRVELF